MRCPFCGAASNPRWVGGYLCGTIDGHQSGLCGSLVRYGERIVMVSEIDALKARIARLEEAGDVMAGRLSILAEFRQDEIMVQKWNISKTSLKEAQP